MLNVGPNRNQAFVEFAELNQAIQMVSYFAPSSEPPQIRGKNVYIQYSNRQEITNNKSTGDEAGNVLLATIEGVQAADISIDVIHLVFSAFGFVHKIATFEKTAGFQALIQYTDAATATEAKKLIGWKKHTELFTSRACRDLLFEDNLFGTQGSEYKVPVAPKQPTLGPDGKIKEPESGVLLATIENVQYAATLDVLHTEALEGHCIYAGGYCKLHLTYSRHTDLTVKNDERSRDYTIPSATPRPAAPGVSWQLTQAVATAFPATVLSATLTGQASPTAWNPAMPVGSFAPAQSTYPNPNPTSQTFAPPAAITSVLEIQQMPPFPDGTSPGAGQKPYYSRWVVCISVQ